MPRTLYEFDLVGTNYLLSAISFIAVFFAIYIIISKNPILSVLFLIGLFFSISMYLIIIGLHFLGLVYLIVYVGAVSILFLFILMLINVRTSELLSDSSNSVPLAILTVLCFNYSINDILPYSLYLYDTFDVQNFKILGTFFYSVMPTQMLNSTNDILTSIYNYLLFVNVSSVSSKSWDAIIVTTTHITAIGNILYTNLFVLFIITSLILLLAMVGAIIITINKSKTSNEWSLSKPHANANKIESNLSDILTEVTRELEQLKGFITAFNDTVNENSINVIKSVNNNMEIDVPNSMDENTINLVKHKINILDNLISTKKESLTEAFKQASSLKTELTNFELNAKYKETFSTFKQLKDSYKF